MGAKIAILANADSFWVQRYIENVSIPLNQDVTIISAINEKYAEYYSCNGIAVKTTKPLKKGILGHKIDALKVSINTLNIIRALNPDVIHVHYAYPYILRLLPRINSKCRKIITFWGSDLLRANDKEKKLIRTVANDTDVLVVGAEDLYTALLKINTELEKKTSIIRMGLTAFDSIDRKREHKEEIRQRFLGKENSHKRIITVGYNAGKAQQHLKVINKLSELPQDVKRKFMIILPLTYQNEDKNYLDQIKRAVNDSQIDNIILTDFMNDVQIAELCLATDFFINAQATDAISASMLEHIYSGSVVLNGAWLEYAFLEENHIECYKFEDFNQMKEQVFRLLMQNEIDYNTELAAAIVKNNFSWNISKDKWKCVYDALRVKN